MEYFQLKSVALDNRSLNALRQSFSNECDILSVLVMVTTGLFLQWRVFLVKKTKIAFHPFVSTFGNAVEREKLVLLRNSQ
jgi:hypothetical protein